MVDITQDYGWTAEPRDRVLVLNSRAEVKDPQKLLVQNIVLPETTLIKSITEYAKRQLPEQTFNHSMRVYYYGNEAALVYQIAILISIALTLVQVKQYRCSISRAGHSQTKHTYLHASSTTSVLPMRTFKPP